MGNRKILSIYSFAFATTLVLFNCNANAEDAILKTTKNTGSFIPSSVFVEASRLILDAGSQIYGTEDNNDYDKKSIKNETETGLKFGIGFDIGSGKELQVSYFRYRSNDKGATDTQGEAYYGNPENYDDFDTSNASFEHKIDGVDLIISKTKIIDNDLNLEISGGLKYASYQRDVKASYYDVDFSSEGDCIHTKSNFKGFGPEVGLEADYKIIDGFSVYGSGNIALVSGTIDIKRTFDSIYGYELGTFHIQSHSVVPIIAGDLGVKWLKEDMIANTDFSVKVGYHMENWQSAVGEARYIDDAQTNVYTDYIDLSMSGFYVRTTFNF
ncbi:MAG: Lpg1974 family pore-forming outer membrane protein [Rickettsiales bacterium]|nr:Lpg1974 family pore-forming outer membrane protein [Rickettsiales bacterium]